MTLIHKFIAIFTTVNLFFHRVDTLLQSKTFKKDALCDVPERLTNQCMHLVGHFGNVLKCAAQSVKDESSVGYSISGSSCFIHFECPRVTGCGTRTKDHVYYSENKGPLCFNGGEWNATSKSCKCSSGWVGLACERRATSCRELFQWGYEAGIQIFYLDLPSSTQERKVTCYKAHGEIRTYILANFGQMDFNRTWTEYENGFFDQSTPIPNFFVGLQALHLINKAGLKEMALGASFWNNPDQKELYQISRAFQFLEGVDVDAAQNQYSIGFKKVNLYKDGHIKNLLTQMDCMGKAKAMPFSTWDSYHQTGTNHAAENGGGWWYSTTGSPCNFVGQRCDSVANAGPRCMSIAGIPMDVFIPRNRLVQIYFKETV